MTNNMNNNYLYNWLFHYNGYENLWYGFTQDEKDNYFNGTDNKYLKSKNIETLMFIIVKAEGKLENVKDFINE